MVFKPQTFFGNEPSTAALETTSGTAIETRVAEALARAGDMDAADVSVTAVDDTIVLSGTVAFPEEIAIAGDIAARIAGVTSVENLIATAGNDNAQPWLT